MHRIILPSSRKTRLMHMYEHPDQTALAARLPLVRNRVPFAWYWRRQPIKVGRMTRRGLQGMAEGASSAVGASNGLVDRLRGNGARPDVRAARRMQTPLLKELLDALPWRRRPTAQRQQRMPERRARRAAQVAGKPAWRQRLMPFQMLLVGVGIGFALMYYFDGHQGRRRRALVRDKLAHAKNTVTRRLPERAGKRGRFLRGVAKGVVHDAADAVMPHGDDVDDETLVARVRSEALRDARFKPGEIHIDAYQGCVTIRGQLDHAEDIRLLVRNAGGVAGVREVRNFLHLPGTPPPNKAEVYRGDQVPTHMRG